MKSKTINLFESFKRNLNEEQDYLLNALQSTFEKAEAKGRNYLIKHEDTEYWVTEVQEGDKKYLKVSNTSTSNSVLKDKDDKQLGPKYENKVEVLNADYLWAAKKIKADIEDATTLVDEYKIYVTTAGKEGYWGNEEGLGIENIVDEENAKVYASEDEAQNAIVFILDNVEGANARIV